MAKKESTVFSCLECGAQAPKWVGRCPECGAWNTFAEESRGGAQRTGGLPASSSRPVPLTQISSEETPRISSGLPHFDRVMGGGIVPGGVVLIAGEPGIGKSTLLLQTADRLATNGRVLYVSGEESPTQIAMRAARLDTLNPNVLLYSETSVEKVIEQIVEISPVAVIVDSIQTAHSGSNNSSAGSVGQVREAAGLLMSAAKRLSVPIFLIGHITKDGTIAGPKTLEHIVDTVLYFEGDRLQNHRLVRAFKNRFGPVNEVAIYRMHDNGLEEVANPSAAMIGQRSSSPGSAIAVTLEGTRPLLVEVQALVSASHFATPRRVAMGVDSNRLSILLAVLEKRTGESFLSHDVYVNVAGGLELDEPAIDLGIVAALVSSKRNVALDASVAVFGEVGLLGEIRGVSQAELRVREARTLGFERLLVPQANLKDLRGLRADGVASIENVLSQLHPRA